MPALSVIRRLDDVEASLDLSEAPAQPFKRLPQILNMEAPYLRDILQRQRQEIGRLPAGDKRQKRFEMITKPFKPAFRTRPIPAAEPDL